jgi:hypothetical protein
MDFPRLLSAGAALLFLAACQTTGGSTSVSVGPGLSTSESVRRASVAEPVAEVANPLDVNIVVFDKGLSTDENGATDIEWPELRRAEARFMAVKVRDAVANTGQFGAVRVTPDTQFSSDLFVEGEILASDGEQLRLRVTATDSTGKRWFTKIYAHKVDDSWYRSIRNADIEPFQQVYDEIAEDLAKRLDRQSDKNLNEVRAVTDLRFAQNLSPDAFTDALDVRRGRVRLERMPADSDPMLKRVEAIRFRDQMFVDTLQERYDQFAEEMDESYRYWQTQSNAEVIRAREARSRATMKALGGILLIAGAIAAGSDNSFAGDVAAVGAGVAGGALLADSWKDSREARVHSSVIDELANSIDGEMAPRVVEMEDQTVTLTGNMEEQTQQWRGILAQIWEAENLPESAEPAM